MRNAYIFLILVIFSFLALASAANTTSQNNTITNKTITNLSTSNATFISASKNITNMSELDFDSSSNLKSKWDIAKIALAVIVLLIAWILISVLTRTITPYLGILYFILLMLISIVIALITQTI